MPRPEIEQTRWLFPDLQDQKPASHVLLLELGQFYVDGVETHETRNVGYRKVSEDIESVVQFHPRASWYLIPVANIELFTSAQVAQIAQANAQNRAQEYLKQLRLAEAIKEQQRQQLEQEGPPKEESHGGGTRNYDKELDDWLRRQTEGLGEEPAA